MSRPPAPSPSGLRAVRPPAMPQPVERAEPVAQHEDRPPSLLPPPRHHDRRAIRAAVRARRRAEAAERRRPGIARRGRIVVVAGAAIGVLLVAVPLVLAFGPAFAVRTIAVSGAQAPVAAAVRQALRGQLGRPVALVDDAGVAAALRAVPAVERFTVVRRPPSTLEVVVVPRTPVAQERTAGGWAVVDASRVTIEERAARVAGLPVVSVPSGADRPARSYAAAVAALAALRGTSVRVTSVAAASPDDVVVVLASGLRVRWGGSEDGAAKAEALQAALRHAAVGATGLDVSAPGIVLTR